MAKIVLRNYDAQDISAMIELTAQFLSEDRGSEGYVNHFKALDFNPKKLQDALNRGLNNPHFFCSLITEDEEIVGGLCATIGAPFYSSDLIAYDEIFYIRPDFTNLKAVFRLVGRYVNWARDTGAVECRLCSSTGFNQHGFTILCKRLGFSQFEIGFMRKL